MDPRGQYGLQKAFSGLRTRHSDPWRNPPGTTANCHLTRSSMWSSTAPAFRGVTPRSGTLHVNPDDRTATITILPAAPHLVVYFVVHKHGRAVASLNGECASSPTGERSVGSGRLRMRCRRRFRTLYEGHQGRRLRRAKGITFFAQGLFGYVCRIDIRSGACSCGSECVAEPGELVEQTGDPSVERVC